MGKALNSATANEYKPDRLTKLGELADARYSKETLHHPPSLRALKVQDVLMKNAGGKIAEDKWHELDLATFKHIDGMGDLKSDDVVKLLRELRAATLLHVNHREGYTGIYGLIAVGRVDFEEVGKIRYKFDDEFRKVAEMSNLYAVLDYRTTLALRSRYAHRLHEMIAFRAGREKQLERFTVEDLRSRLGVATGKLLEWSNLRKYALDRAIEEINQSSRFTVSYRVTKRERRKTVEIELAWKVRHDLEDAKKEQAAHSAARKGRRAERGVKLSFPASGSVKYNDPWERLASENCNWDHGKIADAFRSFCAGKSIRLEARNIEDLFITFCKKQPRI